MKKILFTALIFLRFFGIIAINAQNRAPSVYLDYNDYEDGDILINTLRVVAPSPLYTYYNAMCFGGGVDGGGYCGMQNAPEGHNFIYSLWDPSTVNDTIKAEYIGEGTEIANFGGEGTGLRSLNYLINWLPDQWYTFVTRVWNLNANSYYGFWIFDISNNTWHHVVTMNYPVSNLKFKSRTSAFIEDWYGNGSEVREIHRKDGWKRNLESQWLPFNQATIVRVFPDPGCSNYIDNYDGGVISNDYYFVKSGGIVTSPVTNVSGTTVYLQNSITQPDFQTGEISNLIINSFNDSIVLQWSVNKSKSPQYSYTIEIFDDPTFAASPLTSYSVIKPHARQSVISFNNLPSGICYFKLYIYDIFGNKSNELTNSFTTGISNLQSENYVSIYPNPANDILKIRNAKQNSVVSIYDLTGKLIMKCKIQNDQINISVLPKGMYTLKVKSDNLETVNKLIIQK